MELSEGLARVLGGLLESRTGQQLSPSRHWRIELSLPALLKARGLRTPDELVGRLLLGGDRLLEEQVLEALLNNETSFFRDPAAFESLSRALAERWGARGRDPAPLKVWCAGCSTGQEAYSLAMMQASAAAKNSGPAVDILGTDVSAAAVAQAREGLYSQFEIQRGLPVTLMMRWFAKEAAGWRAVEELRGRARFRRHSLVSGAPPSGRFDMILCRNVLIYFAPDVRARVFDVLADALAPDGLLVLGAGETALDHTGRFAPDPALRGLYRKAGPDHAARARGRTAA